MTGRHAFEAYAQASGQGLEWVMLNAEEQARWEAVERACQRPAIHSLPLTHERPPSDGLVAFCEAILDLSYDHMPDGFHAAIVTGKSPDIAPDVVEVSVRWRG